MKVMLDIPNDFCSDVTTKFQPFFARVKAEIDIRLKFGEALLCGVWEMEEAEMFEKCFADSVIFPDNATNGDVIKAMFPNVQVVDAGIHRITVIFGDCHNMMYRNSYDEDWWNAPYQGGQKNGNDN